MSEFDIWEKVFKKLGYQFVDEETGQWGINVAIYRIEGGYIRLYFNLKTLEVRYVNIKRTSYDQADKPHMTKKLFYSLYYDLFREVKLDYFLEDDN